MKEKLLILSKDHHGSYRIKYEKVLKVSKRSDGTEFVRIGNKRRDVLRPFGLIPPGRVSL